MATQLKRGFTVVQETEFLRHLRREVPREWRDKLVSFFVPVSKRWAVGVWFNQAAGLVSELANYGVEGPTKDTVSRVLFGLNPEIRAASIKAEIESVASESRAQDRAIAEEWEEHADQTKFIQTHAGVHMSDHPTLPFF
jgi:hypothetical protein